MLPTQRVRGGMGGGGGGGGGGDGHQTEPPRPAGIHIIVFLFLHENIHCGYLSEVPHGEIRKL